MRGLTVHTTRSARPAGFSIPELMITLGIMGVGLTLIAGTFPVAVRENAASANNTMGTIMCRNVLGIARAMLRHRDSSSGIGASLQQVGNPGPWQDADNKLGNHDLSYPIIPVEGGDLASATRGCVVLGRGMHALRNDYLLVFVACQFGVGNSAKAHQLTNIVLEKRATSFQASGHSEWLQLGSPVIAPNGRYATIVRVEPGGKVTLNRAVDDEASVTHPFVIAEVDSAGNPAGTVSPTMFVMATRTGLKESEQ